MLQLALWLLDYVYYSYACFVLCCCSPLFAPSSHKPWQYEALRNRGEQVRVGVDSGTG